MRLVIEDNAFGSEIAASMANYYRSNPDSLKNKFVKNEESDKEDLLFPTLMNFASRFFDLSTMIGYERWGSVDGCPSGWHLDKDEVLYSETSEYSLPLCTILYYPEIDTSVGGKFITHTEYITPKTDRLIMFSSGLPHAIEPFVGKRIAVVYNPWSYQIRL